MPMMTPRHLAELRRMLRYNKSDPAQSRQLQLEADALQAAIDDAEQAERDRIDRMAILARQQAHAHEMIKLLDEISGVKRP